MTEIQMGVLGGVTFLNLGLLVIILLNQTQANWKLDQLLQGVSSMASNDQALTDAVTALTAAVTAEDTGIAAIIAALQSSNQTAPDAAITDAITKLQALQSDIQTQTNAIGAAVTPPAAP